MPDREKIIDAVCEGYDFALKHFMPIKDDPATPQKERETYCNFSVQHVCEALGYTGFSNMMANQMIDKMALGDDWSPITAVDACQMVNDGYLVIAGLKDNPHGHVVVCRPGAPAFSSKWNGSFVPKCMNVGADVTIGLGTNWAFPNEPQYFVRKEN